MVKDLEDGLDVIKVWKDTKVPFQVGSQFASNIVTHKARELYLEGKIGKLTAVEAYFD
jgi:predicted dehydrogenase